MEDEAELKRVAAAKDLFVMGPDCGTAFLDGVPFGFCNQIRRGEIGLGVLFFCFCFLSC